MLGIEISVKVTPDKRQEFLHSFKIFTRPERRNDACLDQKLFEDLSEMNRFLWIEYWNDLECLKAHCKTDRFHSLLGAFEVLGEMEKIQLVELRDLSEKIDWI